MPFELDHLFICTAINAPEADRLLSLGLIEGSANRHPGQGTANRRFFFHNCMLELLWVDDPEAAQSAITRPTYLWERWRDRNQSCPFGICLRPTAQTAGELPFSHWNYSPSYLPQGLNISVGSNAHMLTEPMLFYLPFAKRQDSYPADQLQPLNHPIGFRELTRVKIIRPNASQLSPELQALSQTHLIEIQPGNKYLMELGFDGEEQGEQADLQPELPLALFW
jgi:hypothetical protein